MAADALGVGTVEWQAGEELGGHATALARVVAAARCARAGRLRFTQLAEQVAVAPDALEATVVAHRAGPELVVDHERARVHVADRVDEAHDASRTAHVETGQRLAERVEVEERIAGQHVVAVGEQPLVDLALLGVRRVQLVPRVGTTARRAQPRDPQLRTVRVGERLELVELVDVVAGDDDGDLERAEPGVAEVVHRSTGDGVRTVTAHRVVGDGVGAVEADLDVEVVHRRQPVCRGRIDERAVGRELDADPVADRVLDELEEVAPDHRLATTDVDVEDLEVAELVEHRLGLVGGQLARVAPSRRRQAVDALQVARVRQLPREADRGVETALQLLNQRVRAHRASPNRPTPRPPARTPAIAPRRSRPRSTRRATSGGRRGSARRGRCRGASGTISLPVAVVVRERAERLWSQRHLRMQGEGAVEHQYTPHMPSIEISSTSSSSSMSFSARSRQPGQRR